MPDTHYSEAYIRGALTMSPWDQGTRRIATHLLPGYTAWTPGGQIDGPAVITWIQNVDKSIDAIVTD